MRYFSKSFSALVAVTLLAGCSSSSFFDYEDSNSNSPFNNPEFLDYWLDPGDYTFEDECRVLERRLAIEQDRDLRRRYAEALRQCR